MNGRMACAVPDLRARPVADVERIDEAVATFAGAPMDPIGTA